MLHVQAQRGWRDVSSDRKRWSDEPAQPLVRPWMRTGLWVISDQAVVSGSNFITMVLLARVLGPEEFGIYAWALIGLLLLSEVPASVVLAPHNIIGARLEGPAYVLHTSTMAAMQLLISVSTAAVLFAAAAVVHHVFSGDGGIFVALGAAVIAWQGREFVRRVLQTAARWRGSLSTAAIGGIVHLAALLVLLQAESLSATTALWSLVVASSLSASTGCFLARASLAPRISGASAREAWVMGRWLLGSSTASQIGKYVNGMVLPLVAGPGAFGLYRAISQLVGMIDLPIKALGNFLRPTLSRRSMRGVDAVRELVHPLIAFGGAGLLVAAIVAGVFGREILRLVYGDEYAAIAHLVFFVALYPVFTFGRMVLDSAIMALDPSPRSILYAAAAGSLGALVVGPITIVTLGVNGAPASVITAGTISLAALWVAWRGTMRVASRGEVGKGDTRAAEALQASGTSPDVTP